MNVLFYTTYDVSPEKGGTERITSTIAKGLSSIYDVKCFLSYSTEIEPVFERTKFVDRIILLNQDTFVSDLRKFIVDNNIDIVINQGDFWRSRLIYHAIMELPNKHLIFAHHFNPGSEEIFFDWRRIIYDIRYGKELFKNTINFLSYPIKKKLRNNKLKHIYYQTYEYSDVVVLLSEYFKIPFKIYAGIKDDSKFAFIHNSLSFKTFFNMSDYDNKFKEVLIVSRLNDLQKRISLALLIWKEIEKDKTLDDWVLRIVGHGDMDLDKYHAFVKKNRLKRVFFEGMRKPLEYYQRASIFMLTSAFEGWGLTLTEAQQNACVPIAFDSYASLTEIISDGENGFIIPNNDIHRYVDRMKFLMNHERTRREIAGNAVETSHRFEQEGIVHQWYDLLNTIMNNSPKKKN